MSKQFFAHSLPGRPASEWQTLDTHLENVAEKAFHCASSFDSSHWAWNAAWLHDLGKAAAEFQAYLLRENGLDDSEYDDAGPGRVNHSGAGAAYAQETFGLIAGLTIAYIVAGHHAGLPDYFPSNTGRAALQIRLEEGMNDLSRIQSMAERLKDRLHTSIKPPAFVKPHNFHLWIRMLFSCLVDADFLDTESFMNVVQAQERGGYPTLPELKTIFDAHMNQLTTEAERTPVNTVRHEVLAACRKAALQEPGLFSLTVPTGGGKTLSAMAFAFDHAAHYDKRRIVYVIPYTSIIEQTAGILGSIFGTGNVVEHHSNLEPEKETQRSRLASENWDAPIIVTTNVQFFESLYSAKPSRCRKLHNLIDSVVILDEAQLLPPKWLEPCVDGINLLARHYGVTFVFATATQPELPKLDKPREIISNPDALYEKLRRTAIVFPHDLNDRCDWDDIAAQLQRHDQVLCVVNTRRDCYELHKRMPPDTIHLSALMCGQHRSEVIRKVKDSLKHGLPTRVISTQLVEAGVDIDFPAVYRALAGLDAIAQAGGRCNREGRLNDRGLLGQVHVFIPPQNAPRGLQLKGENTTRELMALPDFNPQHPMEFTRYFQLFYSRLNDTGERFMELLRIDVPHIHFRTAGNKFRLIDDLEQQTVFVHYGNSGPWMDELRRIGPKRQTMRKLQRYTVNLSRRDFEKAKADGLVEEIWTGLYCWIGGYNETHGLDLYGAGWAPEDLMV